MTADLIRWIPRLEVLAALVSLIVYSPPAVGQTPIEEGESVKVYHLGDWKDGLVLVREKNRYGVEYQFGGSLSRDVFERSDLRKMCEVEAIDLARIWTSSNGKFKVEAALRSFMGDEVVLIKTDLSEIQVPIASLADKEQLYLKKFKKQFDERANVGQLPRTIPKLPAIEDFGALANSSIASIVGEGNVSPLNPLPTRFASFEQSGCGFYFTRARQELVAVIPVGGPEQMVLVTATEDNFLNQGTQFQSEAYWVSLKQRKVLGSVPLTPEDKITDYDPRLKRLVSVHLERLADNPREHNWMTLWSLKPGDTEAEPLARWGVEISPFALPPFAKLITEDLVLVKTEPQTYIAWNVPRKQIEYTFRSASFFDTSIVMSPDRKTLILPEDGKVSVLDALTGNLMFSLPVQARHVSGACIDSEGKKLAALTEQNVFVWDLTAKSLEPQIYEAPLIGTPFQSRLEWVDDDLLLAEGSQERVLYRLSLQLPVWSYRMDIGDHNINRSPLVNHVLNGLLFYVAQPDPFKGSVAVGAVKLPGPQVDEIVRNIDRSSLMIIKAGTRVGLKAEAVNDPSSVEQWLEEKIRANDWVYDADAPIQLIAKMGVGESRSESYREMGSGGKVTNVRYTPHFATLTIQRGETVIWQSGISTGPPPIVRADNVQVEVSKTERPQTDFFRYVAIPKEIIDPKYSRGFGVSKLGLRGIEIVSTSPPGREDNPSETKKPDGAGKKPAP